MPSRFDSSRVLHARVGRHVARRTRSPARPERDLVDVRLAQPHRALGEVLRREVVDRLDDQLVVLLVDQADRRGLGLHHLADDLHGALEHLLQVARLGEHHRDVVDGRQLVDALAELELLEAQPGDRVGEQEQELDGGGAGVLGCGCSCVDQRPRSASGRGRTSRRARRAWPRRCPAASRWRDMRIVPSRWSLTMIGATYSRPPLRPGCRRGDVIACGASASVCWRLRNVARRRGLGEDVAVGVGDGRLDVGDGGEAVLDLLERRQVHEVGQAQVVRAWSSDIDVDASRRRPAGIVGAANRRVIQSRRRSRYAFAAARASVHSTPCRHANRQRHDDLHYERARARGTPLVLLHGFPLDSRMWEAQRRRRCRTASA